MELFKYCKEEHLEGLLANGGVRIGTLSDFRRTGKYGDFVADAQEGSKRLGGVIENLNSDRAKQLPGLHGLIHMNGGHIGRLEVSNYVYSIEDAAIFSASLDYSELAHRQWLEREGYNCCYRIASARLFFKAISEALGPGLIYLGFAPVIYSSDIDISSPEAGIHPALVKRTVEHEIQNEVRALWRPTTNRPIEPIVVSHSRAPLYCTLHRKIAFNAA